MLSVEHLAFFEGPTSPWSFTRCVSFPVTALYACMYYCFIYTYIYTHHCCICMNATHITALYACIYTYPCFRCTYIYAYHCCICMNTYTYYCFVCMHIRISLLYGCMCIHIVYYVYVYTLFTMCVSLPITALCGSFLSCLCDTHTQTHRVWTQWHRARERSRKIHDVS